MRSIRAVPAFFLLLTFTCTCVAVSPGEIKREEIEWCDVWMPNMTRTDKPRVMLIGDSITRGYFKDVEEGLKGKAYCARVATSKAIGDPALLVELTTFLAEAKFDVVHFNVGMHGWDYTEQEYRQHLPELLRAIREAAPEAKLIWASTTPVRKDRLPGPDNRRIEERNAIAREYFTRQRIPIDDLYTLMLPQADLHSDDVHFNAEGCSLLAEQVA
ncbi:MAG TPA: SGNH/GDSL hydrolase family protein, partial [Bryobacteraceae bacterium]|nr:SGNH/GDSL hydrolase family protein [Bryobacteraceae bacterium]